MKKIKGKVFYVLTVIIFLASIFLPSIFIKSYMEQRKNIVYYSKEITSFDATLIHFNGSLT